MLARAVFFGSILSLALLLGCSHKSNTSVSNARVSATRESQSETEHEVCALLDPKEVEAVLGGPLAVPPYHIDGPRPQQGGTACAYDDANFHRIKLEVTWEGASMVWKMYGSVQSAINQNRNAKGTLHLADGSDVAGEWDEARVGTCCTFMALRGDQMVTVDISGTTAVTIQQAAQLADAAVKRLDKPLPIDGGKGVQPAIDFAAAHRPKRVDPCTLLTRAEAEAVIGPLPGDPKSQGDTCTYPRAGQGNINLEVDLKVQWQGGLSSLRETNALGQDFAKGFLSGEGLSADLKQKVEKTIAPPPEANPAWEASGPTVARGYSAVKRDVLVTVDGIGLSHEQTLALLAKAMSKI